MPSMKAIKRRITSVKNTKQIMKAMNLVAASKVQKFKTKMEAVRPMFHESADFLAGGIDAHDGVESVYLSSNALAGASGVSSDSSSSDRKVAYIVITGERGLCGSYNANIFKAALTHMESKNERIIAVGARCKEFFVRRGKTIVGNHAGVLENVPYSVAEEVAQSLVAMFTSEDPEVKVDEIYIAYTKFETLLSHEASVVKLLPFDPSSSSGSGQKKEIIYEPDIDTYLRKAVPVYLAMFIYGAMLESSVCEQASRMTSMDAAARNADEIVDNLTLQYNRQRQGAITQEISEIVGGANAI